MKKFVSVLLASVFVLCMLCSCHGSLGLNAFEMPEAFDESTPIEITFWAKNDTNKKQTEIYKKAISDFQALYPNVTVTLRLYTDYARIYNDVITNMATQTTPNVCITYPDHIATYKTGVNTVVPLDELMQNEQYGLGGSALKFDGPTSDEMVPEFLAECVLDGQVYAVPYMRSTEACYINKTYVEKLGFTVPDVLTWDFIWQVSEAATAKNEDGTYVVNGQNVLIPFIYKSTDNMMIQYAEQVAGDDGLAFVNTTTGNATALTLLKQVNDATASGAFSTFKISSYPANFLNRGQCIFAIDSTAGSTWMGCDAPLLDIDASTIVQFETVVRAVPQVNPDEPLMISQGPSICVFNKENTQEVLASWLFVQYLLTDDVQCAYAQTEGYLPVTTKAQNSEEYQQYLSLSGTDDDHYSVKIDATRLLMDNVENTFTTPVFNGSASVREALGQLIEEVTKSVLRKETVDDAYYTALFDKMVTRYSLNQTSSSTEADRELGPMPSGSVALLVTLCVVWVGIGVYAALTAVKTKKQKNKTK